MFKPHGWESRLYIYRIIRQFFCSDGKLFHCTQASKACYKPARSGLLCCSYIGMVFNIVRQLYSSIMPSSNPKHFQTVLAMRTKSNLSASF